MPNNPNFLNDIIEVIKFRMKVRQVCFELFSYATWILIMVLSVFTILGVASRTHAVQVLVTLLVMEILCMFFKYTANQREGYAIVKIHILQKLNTLDEDMLKEVEKLV